jgi:SHS2 domain-containing protein
MAGDSTKRHPRQGWEHFEHVADVGVRGFGASMAVAFEQAAVAMTAIVADPATVRAGEAVDIRCRAHDPEILLTDWLNAVIFEMSARRMLFSDFRVSIAHDRLNARILGEEIDPRRHRPAAEVKGATLSELRVARDSGGWWLAQCIVDV